MKIPSFSLKSGATLVEVMIALLIIALIILGGGMFFFYGRVNIIREAHRRAALLVASQRLEQLKAADYSKIDLGSNDKYYIIWSEDKGDWDSVPYENPPSAEAQEPVDVDNLSKDSATPPTMVTKAEYVDDDVDDTDDYLKITVTVEWSDSTTSTVSLTTLIAPH